jgi:hypothetical protein
LGQVVRVVHQMPMVEIQLLALLLPQLAVVKAVNIEQQTQALQVDLAVVVQAKRGLVAQELLGKDLRVVLVVQTQAVVVAVAVVVLLLLALLLALEFWLEVTAALVQHLQLLERLSHMLVVVLGVQALQVVRVGVEIAT